MRSIRALGGRSSRLKALVALQLLRQLKEAQMAVLARGEEAEAVG